MLARSTRWSTAALVSLVAATLLAGCERRVEPTACSPEPRAAVADATPDAVPAAAAVAAGPAAVPVDKPAAAPAPSGRAVDATASRLRVKRLVLAEGVDGREPMGSRSAFRADEMDKVYAFVEVDNPEQLGGAITVSFEPPDGPEIGNVRLAVGASRRWRTWAFSRAVRETGEWTAIVRDEQGRILAREPFSITL